MCQYKGTMWWNITTYSVRLKPIRYWYATYHISPHGLYNNGIGMMPLNVEGYRSSRYY